ncbi:MAG: FAD-binding protein [Planctomycetes bacterium]|nr:FAD-binding protein [Planctomycetota bacterium]
MTATLQAVSPDLIQALQAALGADHVFTDRERLEPFGRDETEDLHVWPEVAVFPGSTAEVQAVVRLAAKHQVPIVARGGGTGLSGGAIPVRGGIVLSTRRMNEILELDEANLVAVVQPGIVTQTFQETVEAKGLFYPPDPASRGSCVIGGNLAECAGGPRCVKYGVTRDYVLGLEVVLASGEVIRTGGKLYKDVTGYNLTQLFVGSEGTLGIITEATLRLIPLPPLNKTLMAPFPTLDQAAQAVSRIFQAGITPSACELLSQAALNATEEHLGKKFPREISEAAASLLLEVDGFHDDDVERDALRLGEVCLEVGAEDVLLAGTPERARELWGIRRSMGEAVKSQGDYREYDVAVPRALMPDALRAIDAVLEPLGLRALSYGHAGDGNLHVNVLRDALSAEAWAAALEQTGPAVVNAIVKLGGTISGEHGIGWIQRGLLGLQLSPANLALQRGIKASFDPHGILNPDKVLPPG